MAALEPLTSPAPNEFTRGLGELLRQAREEKGLSQRDLANRISGRQATISALENGKTEPSASLLVLLAQVLEKPVTYFFPEPWGPRVARGDLTYEEQALLLEFRRLRSTDYRHIAVTLVNALAGLEA